MKKSLFTLAALATIMASCSSDDLLVDEQVQNNETQTAIGFSTFANKATRAAENSGEEAELSLGYHHANFAVWGFKDVDVTSYVFGTSTTVGTTVSATKATDEVKYTKEEIDAAKAVVEASGYVTGTDTESETVAKKTVNDVKTPATYTWSYSPIRFWDKNSNRYDFYAAAPVTSKDATPHWELNGVVDATDATKIAQNPKAGYFTLNGVVLADETLTSKTYSQSMNETGLNNTDYMLANEKYVEDENYGSQVGFDFNHILSRLNVTVARGAKLNAIAAANSGEKAKDVKLQIVKLEVHNILSKGNFNESTTPTSPATLAGGTTVRWSSTSTGITYTGNAADNVTDRIYLLQSLIIPQNVTSKVTNRDGSGDNKEAYLYVEYKIGTDNETTGEKAETFKAYYNLASVFGVATDYTLAFNEGWQNTLNLTIDADAIEFTANTYNWQDGPAIDKTIE